MDKNEKKGTEQDRFWDLSALIPKRIERPFAGRMENVDATEIGVSRPMKTEERVFEDVPLTERPVRPQSLEVPAVPQTVYNPQGALVREVRIYSWKNEYTYYEQFRRHAEKLVTREGTACAEVDFFSYMPQYTQLNQAQAKYYLWWRTNFRRGQCLPVAYSYLLLYLYELINLDAEHQDVKEARDCMMRLWLAYREKYPKLDALVREWLCDFCLLHRIEPPVIEVKQYRTLLSACRLKEFYIPTSGEGEALISAVLLFCNNYDYTKSKFYRDDTKDDYDRVLRGAVKIAIAFLRESSGAHLTDATGVSTISRDAFVGAICSYRIKRRIEVDYTSFSYTHELRYIISDVLKYAENALRQHRGIKSRLSIYSVSTAMRERLDAYLRVALPSRESRAMQKKQEIPEYERRYDLPVTAIDIKNAAAIEASSWQTTKRLVEAFEAEENTFTPETVRENVDLTVQSPIEKEVFDLDDPASNANTKTAEEIVTKAENNTVSPLADALGALIDFLPLALRADRTAQREFAKKQGLMLDAIADKINTVMGDILGDVVLEEQNGVYEMIPDYLDFLIEQGVLPHE